MYTPTYYVQPYILYYHKTIMTVWRYCSRMHQWYPHIPGTGCLFGDAQRSFYSTLSSCACRGFSVITEWSKTSWNSLISAYCWLHSILSTLHTIRPIATHIQHFWKTLNISAIHVLQYIKLIQLIQKVKKTNKDFRACEPQHVKHSMWNIACLM